MVRHTVFVIALIVPLTLGLLLAACDAVQDLVPGGVRGEGEVVEEERSVEGVREVNLATLGELTIVLGEQESLVVEAEANLQEHLVTEVRGGVLTIRTADNVWLSPTEPVRYRLTVPALEALRISSSGDINAPDLTADAFTVSSSSSGTMVLAGVTAERLNVEISSSGDIEIVGGQVAEQQVTLSSSGDYEAGEMQSESAEITISSSGNATVWVTGELDVTISSSGNVNYYGAPEVSQQVTSSGRVAGLGER